MIIQTLYPIPVRPWVTLTTYIHEPDPMLPIPAPPRPAILICPGGGYSMLSPAEGDPIAMEFAGAGYNTFVLRYSVASNAPDGATRYPAQLEEAAAAMALIRANAKEWQTDPEHIAIMGFSAGAHLCAMLATHWHEPWLAEKLEVPSGRLQPMAAVLGYPVVSFVFQAERDKLHPNPILRECSRLLLGDDPSPELLREVSADRQVSEHTPPIFLCHAADDGLVPVEHSLLLGRAMAEAGRPFEMHIFQQGDHGFALGGGSMEAPWNGAQGRAAGAWVGLVKTWLLKQYVPEAWEQPLPPMDGFPVPDQP